MIEVRSLVKLYGGRAAVTGLSFSLEAGEILGLVGPNGAGKTTTMRAIAGIIPATSGDVTVAGFHVRTSPIEAKRLLAFVPDDPNLFTNLTVREHLEFTAELYACTANWRETAKRLLAELEMTDRADSAASELSRGMRQKVAIACAFLHDPRLLMLDEPLTGLDPRGIRTLYDMLRRSAALGAAVIVSSHLLSQIETLCTRFLIVREGRALALGTKDEIRAQFPHLGGGASLEEIFFHATESGGGSAPPPLPPLPPLPTAPTVPTVPDVPEAPRP